MQIAGEETRCCQHRLLFPISSKVSFICIIPFPDRITHTTAFVTPVVENWLKREIAQWVHPMKNRSNDPSRHERTILPRSYISLLTTEANKMSKLVSPEEIRSYPKAGARKGKVVNRKRDRTRIVTDTPEKELKKEQEKQLAKSRQIKKKR